MTTPITRPLSIFQGNCEPHLNAMEKPHVKCDVCGEVLVEPRRGALAATHAFMEAHGQRHLAEGTVAVTVEEWTDRRGCEHRTTIYYIPGAAR